MNLSMPHCTQECDRQAKRARMTQLYDGRARLNWAVWAIRAYGIFGPGRVIHTAKANLGLVGHTGVWAHTSRPHGLTAIRSSNVLNTAEEPTEIQTESGGRRKTRGCMLLKDLYELNSVKRVKVVRNSHGQPIGSKAQLLVGYFGIIARNANLLPINYKSWHHMPDNNKNQPVDNIKERFTLEVSNNYVKKALGKKWRDHKSALKKEYFKKNISLKEKLRNVLPGMLRYQWEDVVRFWNSKKGEAKTKIHAHSGVESFACVADNEVIEQLQYDIELQGLLYRYAKLG
ncbi:hypothetical protein CXB51_021407 [Gossypium anomalum]|uniref:Uncharacterized protein n=1 Tax=Gossypium anomalum TaxID=47600 RepID=A0A8J5Y9D5_9ROSI|nr:hypothetical protein CXB51_021407 [Gossypium anomalum]